MGWREYSAVDISYCQRYGFGNPSVGGDRFGSVDPNQVSQKVRFC